MKKLFCLVFSLLTFLTVSCGTQRAAAQTESSIPSMASTSSASSEESSAKKTPPRDDTSETVWSTSDIDVSHVDINKKLIVFSFDDAPDVTLKPLMRTFASFNAQNPDCPASATFFSNGIRIDATTFSRLKEAYAAGFELGNHTNRHKDLTKLPPEKIREEISVVDEILCKIDGKRTGGNPAYRLVDRHGGLERNFRTADLRRRMEGEIPGRDRTHARRLSEYRRGRKAAASRPQGQRLSGGERLSTFQSARLFPRCGKRIYPHQTKIVKASPTGLSGELFIVVSNFFVPSILFFRKQTEEACAIVQPFGVSLQKFRGYVHLEVTA